MSSQSLCLTKDEVEWADFARSAPRFRTRRPRGRKAQGIRYERRAHEHFNNLFGVRYVASPWLVYRMVDSNVINFAQPDALLFDFEKGLITICEMKYQHTRDAYWQMVGKYLPILQGMFDPTLWQFATVEIVKWYDCAVRYPAEVMLRDAIDKVKPGEFGVHIWKP